MNTSSLRALLLLGLGLSFAAPLRADVNSDLAFSSFSDIDVNALGGGKVLQKTGGLINFPRGIITQSLYILDADPATVQKKLVTWDPASHPELKVWLHKSLPPNPKPSDFSALASLPDNTSVNNLRAATTKLDANAPALQLTKEEAALITSATKSGAADAFASSWSQVLAGRNTNFYSDKASEDYYIVNGGNLQAMDETKSLLHADTKVYGQFQKFLAQTPFKTGKGTAAKLTPATLYYDCFDIENQAALGTGAVYQSVNGTSIQSADFEYYINSGIYASVELEQLWPITVNGKNETLVWREDMVSAPSIVYLHGVDRMAAGMIMLQDVKQAVDAFRSEFK